MIRKCFLFGLPILLVLGITIELVRGEIGFGKPAKPSPAEIGRLLRRPEYGVLQSGLKVGDVPAELLERIERYLPDETKTIEKFLSLVQERVESDDWLLASFRDPYSTPLYRDDGEPVGPSTSSQMKDLKRQYDFLLEDYLKNSADSQETKIAVKKSYDKETFDTFMQVYTSEKRTTDFEKAMLAEHEPQDDPFRRFMLIFRKSFNGGETNTKDAPANSDGDSDVIDRSDEIEI